MHTLYCFISDSPVNAFVSSVHSHAWKCTSAITFTPLLSGILEFNGGESGVACTLHLIQHLAPAREYDCTKVIVAETTGA